MIPFGSDQHLDLFSGAASRAADALRGEGTLERAVVLAFPFTDRLDEGQPLPPERVPVATLNTLSERYYDVLADRGFRILTLPSKFAVSSADHALGPGVDHFADPAYGWWADRFFEAGRPSRMRRERRHRVPAPATT